MTCSHCGENRIEYDTAAGHAFCPKCGFVVEESKIVSEVTFGESASGAAILQGSYVGADQRRARSAGPYRRHSSLDSREQTIANGRRQIQALATALRLADHLMEAAQRYFNLAITNNFIQGRKTQLVVAACLYIVCRTEKTSHMLIDFSDILQVNVFTLGSTFLKLVRTLHLVLPLVDPSLYISRFASLLEFGEETPKVVADALRLVQRMDRDWMQTGRRPAGICGACLLIAARMNNFQRSIKEVIAVVKTADITIKKRLEEFKVTPTGKLSVQDFRNLWLEQQCDPPAFTRARKAAKIAKDKRHAMAISDSTLNETGENYNQITTGSSNGEIIGSKRKRDLNDVDGDEIQLRQGISDFYEDNSQAKTGESQNDEIAGKKRKRNLTEADKEGPSARIDKGKQPMCDFEAEVDRVLEEEVNSFLERALQSANSDSEDSKSDADQNEELGSDLDEDDEVKNAILTEDEVKLKTQVWMELNGDYLREMEEKRKQQEIDRQNGIGVRRHKRPRKGRNADQMVASTPAEAARKLFEERNLSKKINFKVLDNLLENLTESIPNTPTSWRDYDPTSISGSGIARSGTPVSNNRWSDEEDYDWNHQSLKLNNKDSLNSTATTPGLTEDGDDYVEYDNNDIYGSESYEKYENDDHNYDNEYEGDPYDESNEDDY
ncbi:Brf1p [Rhizophagus irregularis DAOM 197198w]|uniref:B-related factor 1 n=1 Tax=Rhizophagus irregularis (strain DAOM 197198w) TaxID=1432141 RepID=A0A015IM22_RHIIW|nr:Brf1p [Rhizophagus irregularis DAOM 197198w]